MIIIIILKFCCIHLKLIKPRTHCTLKNIIIIRIVISMVLTKREKIGTKERSESNENSCIYNEVWSETESLLRFYKCTKHYRYGMYISHDENLLLLFGNFALILVVVVLIPALTLLFFVDSFIIFSRYWRMFILFEKKNPLHLKIR